MWCNRRGWRRSPAALHLIARMADGSWRDALTAFRTGDRLQRGASITPEAVYHALGILEDETLMRLTDALMTGDAATVLTLLNEQLLRGREPRVLAESLIQHWRTLVQAMLQGEDRQQAYDPDALGRAAGSRRTVPPCHACCTGGSSLPKRSPKCACRVPHAPFWS
jgi:DNA polymerase III gamma/tau subunit